MGPMENADQPLPDDGDGRPDTGRHSPSEGDRPFGGEDSLENKLDVQIRLIEEARGDVGVARRPDGDLDYLYVRDVILVRDPYLARVREILFGGDDGGAGAEGGESAPGQREVGGGRPPRSVGFIEGVTLLSIAGSGYPDVPGALEVIDRELGAGIATPNHILSVTPAACCPATEPGPVPRGALPDPGICDCGGGDVLIYAPDTGFIEAAARHHRWLAGVTGTPDPYGQGMIKEYGGHGTFVAGVARCMAPLSTVKVTDDFSKGGTISEHEIVLRLNEALGEGPDIISLSAGGATRKDLPLLGFEPFWNRYRYHKNLVLVAAAGNNSSRRLFWPAAFPQVVSVGALSAGRQARAHFSDYGSWVDVYAPGENIVNAFGSGLYKYREPPHIGQERRFHGMARWSGTSFSTPLVSGLIAARMSRTGETARLAADTLLAHARAQRIPGVGPVLRPCDTGAAHDGCHCGCRGCCGGAR